MSYSACRAAIMAAGLLVSSSALAGETLTALVRVAGVGDALVTFDSDLAMLASPPLAISGLADGEELVGIDTRPRDGRLYALSSQSRLYTLNRTTGAATMVGSAPFTPALSGSEFGFDFNPVPDRIRVVTDAEQNLRLHPDLGTVAATDGTLRYAAADANAGANPRIVAAGYINSERCPATTALYVIDADLDILALQNPPNDGVLTTIGSLGIDASGGSSFDVSGRTNIAYLASSGGLGGLITTIYTVNLATGAADATGFLDLGSIGLMSVKAISAPGPCVADFDRSNFVDWADYMEYVMAFESGDLRADTNCDRFIDFFDYDAFIESFETGC